MVSGATAGRWVAAVAGAVAVAVAASPTVGTLWPTGEPTRDPRSVLAAARSSAGVAHEGVVEVQGTLGLPDLPRLGELAALLGGTTRARVWWRSPTAWRVDRIDATGESGTYAVPDGVRTWDFESGDVEQSVAVSSIRLPRVEDLLPPQAARRALAGITRGDRVSRLPSRRVAGRTADGVRVVPVDSSTTVGRLDLYVDRQTGLPLSLLVVPRGGGVPALRTSFVDVSTSRPSTSDVTPRTPPFTRVRITDTPDLASAVDRYAPFDLPRLLAGADRSRDLVGRGGSATYGRGLARFAVLPLPSRTGRPALAAAANGGGTTLDIGEDGEAVLVVTPLLNAVVATSRFRPAGDGRPHAHGRWYLVAGTVDAATLQAAVQDLVDNPPAFRPDVAR